MPEDFMEHMAMYGYEVFTYDISSLRDSASGFTIVIREYDHQGMIDGKELKRLFEMNKYLKEKTSEIYKHLFLQIYSQHLDSYRLTVKERYIQLLNRCPQIV